MNYTKFLQEGLLIGVKLILKDIQKTGLTKDQIFITFSTKTNKILLPNYLKKKYPKSMVIMLEENEYENLQVHEKYFEIDLFFDTTKETIKIPFNKVIKFEIPNNSEEFLCLDFSINEENNLTDKEDNIIDINSLRN